MGFPTGAIIKDLISASLKRKLTTKPPGWELYVNCLKALKLPHSYVTNAALQDVLKTVEAQRQGSSQRNHVGPAHRYHIGQALVPPLDQLVPPAGQLGSPLLPLPQVVPALNPADAYALLPPLDQQEPQPKRHGRTTRAANRWDPY
jgi:hypothetical protein